MSLVEALRQVFLLVSAPLKQLDHFDKKNNSKRTYVFISWHLPLLLLQTAFIFASPWQYIFGTFDPLLNLLPVVIIIFIVLLASVFDKLVAMYMNEALGIERRSPCFVYLCLHLYSSTLFFFLHPILGAIALFVNTLLCAYYAMNFLSHKINVTRLQAIICLLVPLVFIFTFIFLVTFVLNILRNISLIHTIL